MEVGVLGAAGHGCGRFAGGINQMAVSSTPFDEDGGRNVPSSAGTTAIACTACLVGLTALLVLLVRGGSLSLSMSSISINADINPPQTPPL